MKKGNLIAAGAFAALALYVIWETSSFPGSRGRVPGPAVFPVIISVVMLMASLSLVITSLRMKPEDDRPLGLLSGDNMRVYLSMAVLVVYVAVMPFIGFCVTSSVLLFGLIKWFGKYRFHVCALSALAVTGIVYYVFSEVLNVPFRFGALDMYLKGMFQS